MANESLIKQEATFALLTEMAKGIQNDIKFITSTVKQVKQVKSNK